MPRVNHIREFFYCAAVCYWGIGMAGGGCCVLADTIKVYILGGQSNMVGGWAQNAGLPLSLAQPQTDVIIYADGVPINASKAKQWLNLSPDFGIDTGYFGPELNFGRTMADSTPGTGVKVALIKYAEIGINLNDRLRPPSSGGTTGDRYTEMINTIQAALAALPAQYTPVIAGMLWMQGETDGMNTAWANAYETNLTNLIADMRKEENKSDMPFIAGMIHLSYYWMFADVIRNAETNVANRDTAVGVFDVQDLPLSIDSAHFQTAEMVEIGKRFALTMLQVMKKTANKPPLVEAGPRQILVRTSFPVIVNLNGSVADDGKPNGTLSTIWEKVSGPGTVSFGDQNNPVTTVTLPQKGTYHLRLSGSDGVITSMDAATISVDTVQNLSLTASSCSTSYCSPWEFLTAINDGADPANSNDHSWSAYGNWPQTGAQWVQYTWSSPINVNKIDVYWYADSGNMVPVPLGIDVPAGCVLNYWDGISFVPVTGAIGGGVARDMFNATTFTEVTTTSLRLEFTSKGDSSTGILEWRVYGSIAGTVKQPPVGPSSSEFRISFAGNRLFLSIPHTVEERMVTLRLFDAGGRVMKKVREEKSRGGNFSFGLDLLEAARLYLVEARYGNETKTVAFFRMR
jgi:hypothetical protein